MTYLADSLAEYGVRTVESVRLILAYGAVAVAAALKSYEAALVTGAPSALSVVQWIEEKASKSNKETPTAR